LGGIFGIGCRWFALRRGRREAGKLKKPHRSGRVAQLVRAPASHAGGHRFESCRAHHKNQQLALFGMTPNHKRTRERTRHARCWFLVASLKNGGGKVRRGFFGGKIRGDLFNSRALHVLADVAVQVQHLSVEVPRDAHYGLIRCLRLRQLRDAKVAEVVETQADEWSSGAAPGCYCRSEALAGFKGASRGFSAGFAPRRQDEGAPACPEAFLRGRGVMPSAAL
jgi:hypothetical protein